MASVETILANAGIPSNVQLDIVEYARPTHLDNQVKDELELMASYNVFKMLRQECDRLWEPYYKHWNHQHSPGNVHQGEREPNPPHMWGLIEDDLVNGNKELAQHYILKLREIINSPELLEKLGNFQKQHWEYQGMPSLLYVEKTITVTPRELMKDLVSWADCLQTIVDRIERAEAHQAFRATFETDEDYEDYLIDQQNEEFLEQISTHEGYMEWRYG